MKLDSVGRLISKLCKNILEIWIILPIGLESPLFSHQIPCSKSPLEVIYHYYPSLDVQIAWININSSLFLFYKFPNFLNLIDQLHAHSSPGLSLQDPVGTADPGILGDVLPLVQLLLHLL